MKKISLLLISLILCTICVAQQENGNKTTKNKVVDKAKKINDKTREFGNASNEVADHAKEIGDNVNQVAKNVKSIIKIFEPIVSLHFKKNKALKNNMEPAQTNGSTADNAQMNEQPTSYENGSSSNNQMGSNTQNNQQGYPDEPAHNNVYGTPENDIYNTDGTMNIGHQNNVKYGNCLNLLEAKVMGMGEAEDDPAKIDLIFFSQFGGLGYTFQSPYEAPSINEGVSIKSWREKNETQIAETKLTIAQFEKITTNTSLLNTVKNAVGYQGASYFIEKMEGRVFAIKVQQDDKELYALLAVFKQFGTSGSKGYLQIKIKVQGVDKNGDGNPDVNAYLKN